MEQQKESLNEAESQEKVELGTIESQGDHLQEKGDVAGLSEEQAYIEGQLEEQEFDQVAEEPAQDDESHKDFAKAEELKNEGNELFR